MDVWLLLGVLVVPMITLRAHELKWGQCPNVEAQKEFDYNQFLGKWYVIEKTRSLSSCITYTFLSFNGSFYVEETARPLGISIPFVFESFTQIGALSVPNRKNPAKMTVAFPFSIIPNTPVAFWILETNYDKSALIWSCRPLMIGHAQSAMILSRQPSLDRNDINRMRNTLDYYGINKYKLSFIDQESCRHNRTLDPGDLEGSHENPEGNDTNGDLKLKTTTRQREEIATQSTIILPTANDADNMP